ncbi:MAG: PA2928 family protein [Chitinophagaceae bacterium]
MTLPVKFTLSLLLFMGLLVLGFMFLLRGCLSKYDERSILPKVLYFKEGNKEIVFSIVKFDKTTSYTQSGGFTSKSVNTTYSLQINDAITGEKLNEKQIIAHSEIKNHPVKIMGAAGKFVWAYINEPIVFDPFTLQTVATVKELEDKNPALKGGFPAEERFYEFDNVEQRLYLTAKNGSRWVIDGQTFLATTHPLKETAIKARIKELDQLIAESNARQAVLMEEKLRNPSKRLAAKEIDFRTYQQYTNEFYKSRDSLYKNRDSLDKLRRELDDNRRSVEELETRAASLQKRFQFTQAKLNADTTNGQWIGIYAEDEMEELSDRVSYQAAYNDAARRLCYITTYTPNTRGEMVIHREQAVTPNPHEHFLNGGFLTSNETGKPLRLSDGSFLLIYKNEVGNNGKILLSKLTIDGKTGWTYDTGLTEWANYIFTGKQLIITAEDNKELTGDDCNILLLIELQTGKAEKYDYFYQKKRTE